MSRIPRLADLVAAWPDDVDGRYACVWGWDVEGFSCLCCGSRTQDKTEARVCPAMSGLTPLVFEETSLGAGGKTTKHQSSLVTPRKRANDG